MTKLSVIVPVYKCEQYLDRCINSIVNQTYTDLEIILINDGSPDSSPEICEKWATLDSRIKVIHQKNQGVAAARNVGIETACGEYFGFVDSDDYIDSNMYQEMINIAMQYDIDIVMCDCLKEFENNTILYSHNIRSGLYNNSQLLVEYYPNLLITNEVEYPPTISNWTCIFRNNSKVRYVNGIKYSEDLLFGAERMLEANSFYYMKGKGFYHYNCLNQLSATHQFDDSKWDNYITLYHLIQDKFSNHSRFDFSSQIERVLLFFIYNTAGEILTNVSLTTNQKRDRLITILEVREVRDMFHKVQISKLNISFKQKVITYFYKNLNLLPILIFYYEKMR